jgi:hypothetical protein
MKFDTNTAIKAGLIGAAAAFIAALITRIPFVACLAWWLPALIALVTGALYVHFAGPAGVEIGEGAVGGAIAGAIAGLINAVISGLLNLIFGAVRAGARLMSGQEGALAAGAIGIGGVILGIIVGTIVGAVLGALGGLLWAAIKGGSKA